MFGSRGTRWLAPNRYASTCVRCEQTVPAGTGEFRNDGTRWIVRHSGGLCHTVAYTQYVSQESVQWQQVRHARMEYSGHQCEWRGWFSGRCIVTWPLQCHHRHYRNLGAEPLGDLIMLCIPHHNLADSRRKLWGAWPLIGHPFWNASAPIADSFHQPGPTSPSATVETADQSVQPPPESR